MEWTVLLNLVLITLVAGDGAWNVNHVYTYKLITKSLTTFPKLNNLWVGANFRGILSIYPQSENLLIAQLNGDEYVEVEVTEDWDPNSVELEYKPLPLTKPFTIHLKNDAMYALSVDSSTTNDQINRIKVILSQLQVDIQNGKDDVDRDSFKITEQTMTGNCETNYFISPITEYSMLSDPELIPLAKFKPNGKFIDLIKTRNYNNCTETIEQLYKQSPITLTHSEANRIVLSGSKKSFSILSSVTAHKVVANDANLSTTISYVKVTLDSMEKTSKHPNIQPGNLLNIRSLIYNKNVQNIVRPLDTTTIGQDDDRRWSDCYTSFVPASSMCKNTFNAEWEPVGIEGGCGFLGLGHRATCKHSFPGCKATSCWSLFVAGICEKEFGSHVPIENGGFEDCSPGFKRNRCCPN